VKALTGNKFLAAAALVCLLPVTSTNNPGFGFPGAPPAQITGFYEDFNFVVSFSTFSERQGLVRFIGAGVLPKAVRSDRLEEVFSLMKKLCSHMLSLDPGIFARAAPGKPHLEHFFRPEWYEVQNVKVAGREAVVELKAYSLHPEFINEFIARYEESEKEGGEIPSARERLEKVKAEVSPKTEYHNWFLHDGTWKMSGFKHVYIRR